jgi:tetratricopeptide (TPR) repeat protein
MRARHVARALTLAAMLEAGAAGASSASELVRMARAHESAHEDDVALRRYMEALTLDPTCEDAYLGLGALRVRQGDLREADRVYSVGIERLPQVRDAIAARARVRRALGFRREAVSDLMASTTDEVAALRTVALWHGQDGQTPAQLAVWRRLAAIADATGDVALAREARTMVQALVLLVGPADPVAAPPVSDDGAGAAKALGIRGVLAQIARRGG